MSFLRPEEVDGRLNWPLGRAERLARRGKVPHVVLPDGSIRFEWESIETLLRRVSPNAPASADSRQGVAHGE
jgi:hypothetical protein